MTQSSSKYRCEDLNKTRRKFDALAKELGFKIHILTDEKNELEVSYYLPDKRSGINSFVNFQIHYRKYPHNPEKTGCVVFMDGIIKKSLFDFDDKSLTFYMDDLQSAYEMLFALFFTPEKVRYEDVRGRKRMVLSERDFIKTGNRAISADFWFTIPGLVLRGILSWLTIPLRMATKPFQKWEYLCEHEGDEFVLIRRYCGGRHKRLSIIQNWMIRKHSFFWH